MDLLLHLLLGVVSKCSENVLRASKLKGMNFGGQRQPPLNFFLILLEYGQRKQQKITK